VLDFFQILVKETRGVLEVRPDFVVSRSKDLMVQGGDFYAVWDEKLGLWSRDKYRVAELVDEELRAFVELKETEGVATQPKYLKSFANGGWKQFNTFLKNISDNAHPLDTKLTFANTTIKKADHASRRLPYDIGPGDMSAYEKLVSLLYAPEEREKFEWGLGSIIVGDSKKIEKFMVFFGDPGTGKSTVMKIAFGVLGGLVKDGGYVATFDAKGLVGSNNAFSMEPFRDNPLLALQHDSDLSRIEDNSKLNSIVSHEDMRINEKYKATYDSKINAQLWLGTNKDVKITDGRSGLVRRLIDIHPTGMKHDIDTYLILTERVNFELGAIAHHCAQVYRKLGRNYYAKYIPEQMIKKTNVFYNYVEYYHETFAEEDGVALKRAFAMWRDYCKDADLEFKMPLHRFREELKLYFESFTEGRSTVNGVVVSSYFSGFKADKFKAPVEPDNPKKFLLVLEDTVSLLDEMCTGLPAQYAGARNNPKLYWDDSERIDDKTGKSFIPEPGQVCSTILGDIDSSKLHFLKLPSCHIVIDFDLTGEDGKKSLEANLEAAAAFPPTYGELSKSGNGVHLHYIYDGDVNELASVYSPGIEVKVFNGNASLRRKLTKCNSVAVATISSGLPHKETKDMLQTNTLKSERGLRALILKNLRKEIHVGTKPSVDFIEHLLNQAYTSGMIYDVTDMKPLIIAFANESTHQAAACFKAVTRMRFKSELSSEEVGKKFDEIAEREEKLVFFDCEVYPNLFVICWKYRDGDPTSCVRMINPTPMEVEKLLQHFKLVGFNNRDYDNHILWARYMGYSNEQLYELSQRIIARKDRSAKFAEAYNVSYADVYDFSVKKQGLKAWEIELGGKHMEMDIPWDKPVPENKVMKVVEYCCNDVIELERVFEHLHQDFVARQILADLSGLPVNTTTRNHAGRIIFGTERNPQREFVYTDLSKEFPGYSFDKFAPEGQKSTYSGEFVGEGGYVYSEPGIYDDVVCLDVASMHPTSIESLRLFGPYTVVYSAIKEVRLYIKHARVSIEKFLKTDEENYLEEALICFGDAKKLFQGKLRPHVEAIEAVEDLKERARQAKTLENALKLVINSVYGYTAAKFQNLFRDPRNIDNIVAKRGALFMIKLKHFVQELGYQVVHIKTDSIKIPNADADIIEAVTKFGDDYGYDFEVESKYKKLCLVNDAVYVAKDEDGRWSATGAQFQHPYVFKRLFTGEGIDFQDLCEKKQVKEGVMYLDDIDLGLYGDEYSPEQTSEMLEIENKSEGELVLDHNGSRYHIGRTGLFVPVSEELGGKLIRVKDDKEYAVAGTKGYYWVEAEMLRTLKPEALARMSFERVEDAIEGTGSIADIINLEYFEHLAEKAVSTIEKFGSYKELTGSRPEVSEIAA
jgi:DNA polymerase elongation subunit (family B)